MARHEFEEKPTVDEINRSVEAAGDQILQLLEKFGPMMLPQILELLKLLYVVEVGPRLLAETLYRMYQDNKRVLFTGTRFCLPQDADRTPVLPDMEDYNAGYFKLLLRWLAVRENPALLELTDNMIDRLYAPGTA